MRELILSCGEKVLLDDKDYETIPKTGWYLVKGGNSRTMYATHDIYGRLHRYLLGLTKEDDTIIVDHIDRNGLNNQRNNLRIVSNSINKRNQTTCTNNRVNFNGISIEKGQKPRFKVSYMTDIKDKTGKRYQQKTKSFSMKKYGINEALRLAVQYRLEKMEEFGYLIDERSETIKKAIQNKEVNMEELLNIDFQVLGLSRVGE